MIRGRGDERLLGAAELDRFFTPHRIARDGIAAAEPDAIGAIETIASGKASLARQRNGASSRHRAR